MLRPRRGWAGRAALFQPYSVAEALDDRQMRFDIAEHLGFEIVHGGRAGDWPWSSDSFNDLYLPIASNHCGVALFVDLREGSGSGLVGSWDNVEGADDAVHWDSVADMLTDIAGALSYGHSRAATTPLRVGVCVMIATSG